MAKEVSNKLYGKLYRWNRDVLNLQCISIHKLFNDSQIHPPEEDSTSTKLSKLGGLKSENTQEFHCLQASSVDEFELFHWLESTNTEQEVK